MSAVDEARQRPAAAVVAWPARLLHYAVAVFLAAVVVLVVGTSALAWRLAQGPLDIGWLARRIETSAFPQDAPTRLAVGSASMAWNGFDRGPDSGLELRLHDLRVIDRSGTPGAELAEADVTISLLRLLEARVVPRSVRLTGLRLRAVRAPDGTIRLNLGSLAGGSDTPDDGGASLAEVLAELRRPAGSDRGHTAPPSLDALAQLRHVRVQDARVELDDQGNNATVSGDLARLDLERMPGGGVKGAADGRFALGDAVATLQLQADLLADGGTQLQATLAPLNASALGQSNPALASLGALHADIQGRARLDLSPALLPRTGEVHASSSGGTFTLPESKVSFERLRLDGAARWAGGSWRPEQFTLQQLEAVLSSAAGGPATTLSATGTAGRRGGAVEGRVDLTLDRVAFGDLPGMWPAAWGGNVRPWLTANVTSGVAHDGALTLALTAPENDLSALTLADASGTLRADDVTINWLRPVPPIEHAQARLKVAGPDVIEIAIPTAVQGPIALKDGLIRFTGLTTKDQAMALTTNLQGSVPDALNLLRHPRLKLLDRHKLPIQNSAGTVATRLTVEMPLVKNLNFDQVKIAAQGRFNALHLGGLVAGRDLDRGDIQFDVTQDGFKANGAADVAGIAGAVAVDMDFRAGPPDQVLQRASVSGRATPAQLVATGADPGELITAGYAVVDTSYTSRRDGSGQVDLKADLTASGLALAGWRKPPGPAASAAGTILLSNDKVAGITDLRAQGPGLEVVGRAEMVGDRPRLLHLDKFVLGPTEAAGDIQFPERPNEPIRARIAGAELDLSSELNHKDGRAKGGSSPAWIADIRFGRVMLAKGKPFTDVTAHAEHDGKRLRALQLSSTGPERVQAVIAPQGIGRRVTVRATDAGALLAALDVTDTVHGGTLALDAEYDDRYPEPPLAGTLDLAEFGVRDAVVVGKLLQAVTIYGIADALRGEGVQFSRLILPFRFDENVLHIGESRAYSASLGLTARGSIDLNRKLLDLHGTVVPAYALNSALGRIPLVGRLFSPEHGGGLVAVNYGLTGKLSDPSVTVNPLSALTPGFLRGLFNIFD